MLHLKFATGSYKDIDNPGMKIKYNQSTESTTIKALKALEVMVEMGNG